MKIKPYKNKYGHTVADCPFCKEFFYIREVRGRNSDPLRDLKRHITNQAKNEALDKELGETREPKHLIYYLEHTEDKVVRIPTKRQYDSDLSL